MLDEFSQIASEFAALLDRKKTLEGERQSAADRKKLTNLLSEFRARLQRFEFSSLSGQEVVLADDNLRPVMEQRDGDDVIFREIGLNLSASDAVRLKWAYELALLAVARESRTNHPGFLVLDEPGQHQMEWSSMRAFLRSIAEDACPVQQVIVATSLSRELIEEATEGFEANILPFGGLILQPSPGGPSKGTDGGAVKNRL